MRAAHQARAHVGAAAEALLIEDVVLVVRSRRRPAARAHRAPVATLEDARPLAFARGARPLVDVARQRRRRPPGSCTSAASRREGPARGDPSRPSRRRRRRGRIAPSLKARQDWSLMQEPRRARSRRGRASPLHPRRRRSTRPRSRGACLRRRRGLPPRTS